MQNTPGRGCRCQVGPGTRRGQGGAGLPPQGQGEACLTATLLAAHWELNLGTRVFVQMWKLSQGRAKAVSAPTSPGPVLGCLGHGACARVHCSAVFLQHLPCAWPAGPGQVRHRRTGRSWTRAPSCLKRSQRNQAGTSGSSQSSWAHAHVRAHTQTCTQTHIYTYVCLCTRTHKHVHTDMCITHTHTLAYIHMHVILAQTYTYTHSCTQAQTHHLMCMLTHRGAGTQHTHRHTLTHVHTHAHAGSTIQQARFESQWVAFRPRL